MRYFLLPKWQVFLGIGALVGTVQTPAARAQSLLKPLGKASQNLQPRSLDVLARVDGAWAQTTVTTTYANANTAAIEADFLYAAPKGAVITGFAYWYGGEKVVAQVTEKERAKAIFALAKDAGSDPALVEMSGKNLFRARIAQVLPKFNLRVEVKYAQPLETQNGVPVWSYPLLADTRDVTLNLLRVRVALQNAHDSKNNFGATLEDGKFSFRKYNFKPSFDPRIALAPTMAQLRANLVTQHRAENGKIADDGYFALSLRAAAKNIAKNIAKTAPQIVGVETFEVLPPQRVNANEIRVFGRYRGKGAATISWRGAKSVVWFAPASNAGSEVAGLAAALWGANKIAQISDKKDARAQIIALSTQFDVPSKWTSWVAMPSVQRRALRAQLRKLDLERRGAQLGRIVALELENARPFSPQSLRARADLRALSRSNIGRKNAFDEEKARAAAIETRMGELGRQAMAASMGITKNGGAGARLSRLASVAVTDKMPYLVRAQKSLRAVQVQTVAAKWTREVVALREALPATRKLKNQLETLKMRYGIDEDFQNAAYQKTAGQMALSTLNEALAGRENGLKAAVLIDAGERYARKCGQMSFARDFYAPTIQTNLDEANTEIVHEIEAGRDLSADARDAQLQVRRLQNLAPELRGDFRVQGSKEYEIDRARRGLAHEVAYRIAQTKAEFPGQKAEISALSAQLDRMADKTEADAADILKEETKRYKNREPLLNARQFQRQLEVASDDPTPLPVQAPIEPTPAPTPDPNADYNLNPAPDTPSQYQVRPGDPLISLDAPQNSRKVVAILPDGALKPLSWNAITSKWETRFDVPTYAPDGGYFVQILLVRADGSRAKFQMRFDIDTAAPRARPMKFGTVSNWKLQLQTESGAGRVSALLPWDERVFLRREADGLWTQNVAVPLEWRGKRAKIRFIVTDSAHNRTEIEVDWN